MPTRLTQLEASLYSSDTTKAAAARQAAQAYLASKAATRAKWRPRMVRITGIATTAVVGMLLGIMLLPRTTTESPVYASTFILLVVLGVLSERVLASLSTETSAEVRIRAALKPLAGSDAAVLELGRYVSEAPPAYAYASQQVRGGQELLQLDLVELRRLHAKHVAQRQPTSADVARHNLRELLP